MYTLKSRLAMEETYIVWFDLYNWKPVLSTHKF